MAFDINQILAQYGQPLTMPQQPSPGAVNVPGSPPVTTAYAGGAQPPKQGIGARIKNALMGVHQNIVDNPGKYQQLGTALMNRSAAGDNFMQGIGNAIASVNQQLADAEKEAYQRSLENRDYDWQVQRAAEEDRWRQQQARDAADRWEREFKADEAYRQSQQAAQEQQQRLLNQIRQQEIEEQRMQMEARANVADVYSRRDQNAPGFPIPKRPTTEDDLVNALIQYNPEALFDYWGRPDEQGYQQNPYGAYRGQSVDPMQLFLLGSQLSNGGGVAPPSVNR